jgi:hypothetical protein
LRCDPSSRSLSELFRKNYARGVCAGSNPKPGDPTEN